MMGLAEIERLQTKAARDSARQRLKPLVVTEPEDVTAAPFLGTRVPRGWRIATYSDVDPAMALRKGFYGNNDDLGVLLFADASGWGGRDEPALSVDQLHRAVADVIASNPKVTFGFGLYEVGQFQCHLRVFVARGRA